MDEPTTPAGLSDDEQAAIGSAVLECAVKIDPYIGDALCDHEDDIEVGADLLRQLDELGFTITRKVRS